MMKYILGGIAAILVALLIAISMQPDEFKVSRTATINATPAQIFTEVNDLKKWDAWSPWAKIDPAAKVTFEGADSGVTQKMNWDGNHEIGKGSMTITESHPAESIKLDLVFIEPMAGVSTSEFTFVPEGNGTLVTWSMYGKNNFMGKAMSLVFDCEKMIGGMYEQGLANLKNIAEAK